MSRYRSLKRRKHFLLNKGFDYRGRILMRTTDENLYKNDRLRGFAFKLEEILQQWTRQAKRVKAFFNYNVEADTDDIN